MAMYPSGDVREILYGTYNPLSEDCLSEEFCAQQLTMTETVTPQFDPYYNIRYSHPETSRRVKYLKKLIHNAAIEYLNTQIQDLSDHNRKEIAYSLKVIKYRDCVRSENRRWGWGPGDLLRNLDRLCYGAAHWQ